MIDAIAALYSRSLQRRFSKAKLDRIFRSLPQWEPSPREGLRLCALQLEAKAYRRPEDWLRELDDIFRGAAREGASLLCLPELYGMIPLLCHPLIPPLLKRLSGTLGSGSGDGAEMDLAPVLEAFQPLTDLYEDILCRFAKKYELHIFGGTAFTWDRGRVYNRGMLVSPEGQILARQDKLHLTAEEMALGLTPGEELRVVTTPIGRIALCVCMDATFFETFRIAKGLGADYIIVPIGDMAPFDHHLALRGVQSRVDETGLAAVKPALVSGEGFPILFTGKAGIWFPHWSPFVSRETEQPQGPGMVVSEISLTRLREARSSGPFLRENAGFSRNHFNAITQYKEGGRPQ